MTEVNLIILYPHPIDAIQFDRDYRLHLQLLHDKVDIPEDVHPYTVTKMLSTTMGKPSFYQMFTMSFPSVEALELAMSTPEMREVGADALRICSGGPPIMLVGDEITSSQHS